MDKTEELFRLEKNRYTEDSQQMEEFTRAITNIASLQDPEDLQELACAFEDNTFNSESMYELIHIMEAYISFCGEDTYVKMILESLEESSIFGHNWMKTMLCRIMNGNACRYYAVQHAPYIDGQSQKALKLLLEEIVAENPESFQEKAQEILDTLPEEEE